MGLIHPESMELWQDWSDSRHRARRLKHAVTGGIARIRRRGQGADPPGWQLRSRPAEPDGPAAGTLLVMDSGSPTARASVLTVLPYLRGAVTVLAPAGVSLPELEDPATGTWSSAETTDPAAALTAIDLGAVVTIGAHLAGGALAHDLAGDRSLPSYVVQHGALTPYAPPLPAETTLLAWSDADADFWRSGRTDVQARTIGSQLLWQAAHEQPVQVDPAARPVFLGQLHGAELPRRLTGGAASEFCRAHGALYRPHPAETDVLSRAQHRWMARRGIEFAPLDVPLTELGVPVVAVFSTGVLESAARGIPSWVYGEHMPAWIHELWHRYGMSPWGADPTPAPSVRAEEPAAALATILEESA